MISKRKFRNIAVALPLLVAVIFSSSRDVWAQELERDIPQCPAWYASADSFLDECRAQGRMFQTTFFPSVPADRGEFEKHRVWFEPNTADEHFLMGCTLNADRSLSFLGIYYTAEPDAIRDTNTAKIVSVTADGDVTILVASHPVTFVAVQPFSTRRVITRWSASTETAKNCEEPSTEHRAIRGSYVDFSSFERDGLIKVGWFPNPKESFKYTELFPSPKTKTLIYSWFNVILITTSGSVFVNSDRFPLACVLGDKERVARSNLLLHQLCRISKGSNAPDSNRATKPN